MATELQKKWNREYCARPDVKARRKKYMAEYSLRLGKKERFAQLNARPEQKEKRKAYKKSVQGKLAEKAYVKRRKEKIGFLGVRELHWKQRYGLDYQGYLRLLEKQGGVCALCKKPPQTILTFLSVDHCHKTDKVRGLLCQPCNLGLGLLRDDTDVLQNAIHYLNEVH